jgi:hypothetical protein
MIVVVVRKQQEKTNHGGKKHLANANESDEE